MIITERKNTELRGVFAQAAKEYADNVASIFAELPAVKTSLVLFDTEVVDLSDQVGQPVDVLLSIPGRALGG